MLQYTTYRCKEQYRQFPNRCVHQSVVIGVSAGLVALIIVTLVTIIVCIVIRRKKSDGIDLEKVT